jgi:ankyrin repeat protein
LKILYASVAGEISFITNILYPRVGETPIYYAALNGDIQLVKYLLDHGGDPAMPNEKGCTPLHAAAQEGLLSHFLVN